MEEMDLSSTYDTDNGETNCENEKLKPDTNDDVEIKTASFCEKWKDPVLQEKYLYSTFMAALIFSLGMCIGQYGATFLDIQIITDTDIESASAFFTTASFGFLSGSVLIGLIYSKVNKPLMMFGLTLGLGVTNIFLPHCVQYQLMHFIRYTSAVFFGGINTGIHSEHMRLWGSEANWMLQFLHFCFSMGGFLSPLIAEPFLAEKADTPDANDAMGNGSTSANVSNPHQRLGRADTKVEYVYLIVGMITVVCSIPFLVIFFKERGRTKTADKVQGETRRFSREGVPFPLMLVLLIWICLFYFTYTCLESSFFSFLMTFVVEDFDSVSKTKGAFIVAVAWASFAAGRFLMIFVTRVLTTTRLLFIMMTAMAIAFSGFTIFAHFAIVDALFVFSAISALSCSGVFASGFSWMETEMFQVTGRISSCILVASSLGSIVNPLILGFLMKEVSNMWFCYTLVIETYTLCVLFFALVLFSRFYIDKRYGTLAMSLKSDSTTARGVTGKNSGGVKEKKDEDDEKDEDSDNHTSDSLLKQNYIQ